MTTDKPRLPLEDDQDPSWNVAGITQLTAQLEPENIASALQTGRRGFRQSAERRMIQQWERWGLGHREMLKSLKSLVSFGSVVSDSSWLRIVAVCSSIQASNISSHIWSETSSVNVAGA